MTLCANSLNNCVQHLPTFTAWSSIDFKVSRVTMSLSFSIFEEQRTLLALPALDPGAWGEPPPVHAPRRSSCRLPPVALAACCLRVAALKLLYLYVKGNRKNAMPSIPERPLENCRPLRTQNACRGSGKWRCGLLGFFLLASFLAAGRFTATGYS